MIGDLLQRLDLHGNVEPIDDVPGRARQGPGQPLHNLSSIGKYGYLAAARITLTLESLKCSRPQFSFRGVRGRKIMARSRTSPPATTSSHGNFESLSLHLAAASDMGHVNADNEFTLGVAGQIKLDLIASVRMGRVEPRAFWALAVCLGAENAPSASCP